MNRELSHFHCYGNYTLGTTHVGCISGLQ